MVIGALTPPLGVLVFTTARVGGADQARDVQGGDSVHDRR